MAAQRTGSDRTGSEGFVITSSPHTFSAASTPKIMFAVVASLVPAIVFSAVLFGAAVLILYATGVAAAVVTELLVKLARKRGPRSILDGSAVVTGLLLVMTLPPSTPAVYVVLGAAVGVFIGKEVFGGLGSNIFNPALVGRAFLAAAYPVAMTSWTAPRRVFDALSASADALSGATPLAAAKFDQVSTPLLDLLAGQTGGSIGETSFVALAVGGIALIALGIVRWPLVVSFLGSIFAFGGIFHLANPAAFPSGAFHVFAGGAALGAFYMAGDMATSPTTDRGAVLFGVGGGLLVILIRLFGGLPEGVMYSILLMNAVTPIIDRYTETRSFGATS